MLFNVYARPFFLVDTPFFRKAKFCVRQSNSRTLPAPLPAVRPPCNSDTTEWGRMRSQVEKVPSLSGPVRLAARAQKVLDIHLEREKLASLQETSIGIDISGKSFAAALSVCEDIAGLLRTLWINGISKKKNK